MSDWNRMRRGSTRTTISTTFVLVALILYFVARADSGLLGDLWRSATGVATPGTAIVDESAPASSATASLASPVPASSKEAAAVAPANTEAATTEPVASETPKPSPTANGPPASARASSLPSVALGGLPPEARDTVDLIDRGGPFPFRNDGTVFQNREGILPAKPEGYYREYTVITPGEDDRGARRIVGGDGGELYYSDDHYASFREVYR